MGKLYRHLLLSLIAISFCFVSCNSTRQVTVKKLKADYATFFGSILYVDKDSTIFMGFSKKTSPNHVLADFFDKDMLFINYLLNRATSQDYDYKPFVKNLDSIGMYKGYIKFLQADPVFNKTFLNAAHLFLKSKKRGIKGFKPLPSLEISDDSLASLAAKFFYAHRIIENNIRYQILNPYACGHPRLYTQNPNIYIEAFAYMQMTNYIYDAKYPYRAELETNMKNVSLINTNLPDDKLLFYARQEMFRLMGLSDYTRTLLLDTYDSKTHEYGFKIIK